jgi:hypothetical protein
MRYIALWILNSVAFPFSRGFSIDKFMYSDFAVSDYSATLSYGLHMIWCRFHFKAYIYTLLDFFF